MLEDIVVGPVLPVQSGAPPAEVPPASNPTAVNEGAVTASHLSLSLELNAAIGIVVIQFRNQSGKVELSIPSQQQLDAYAADPFRAFETLPSTTV